MTSPPQLHLTLPSNTTSFKRSFEQFGFDLESPVGGPEAGSSGSGSSGRSDNGRNSRNKRARSASSLSDGNDSLRSSASSSTFTSGSSDIGFSEGSGASGSSAVVSAVSPPRIPTPDIQDIEMPDYRSDEVQHRPPSQVSPAVSSDENYRILLDGRNDTRIPSVRQSSSLPRSPTPPPTLPPLLLEDEDGDNTPPAPFESTHPSSSVFDNVYSSRRTTDVPPRLPSPIQRSTSLYDLESESSHSTSDVDPSLDITSQTPSSTTSTRPDVIDVRNNIDELAPVERAPSFTERLNAALDTGDSASFRERVSSALDAFRNSNNNSVYDDFGESSSSATARPQSSASSASGRRLSLPAATLSVAIPDSSILPSSLSSTVGEPSQPSQNSGSAGPATNVTIPSSRRIPVQYRGLSLFEAPRSASGSNSPRLGVEPPSNSALASLLPPSPSRLSPIQFLDPVWDLEGDNLTGTAAGGSSTDANVSASSSTAERPFHWRQIPRPSSAQPDHQRRSLLANGLRRRSSFSRDFTRWLEDSSSDADPVSSRANTGPINHDDTSEGEDDRPVIPRLSDFILPSDPFTNSSRGNASNTMRNAGSSAQNSQEREDFLQSRARRLIAQGLLDPRERSLTERRREESESERTRRERSQRIPIPERRPSSEWQFSWNEALDRARTRERERRERQMHLDFEDFGNWFDESPRDDTDSGQEISESERIYQQSRRMRLAGLRPPGSSLFDPTDSDWRPPLSRAFSFGYSRPEYGPSSTSISTDLRRSQRPRIHGPRPGASNSLLTENAAEIRRRNARAELIEQYSSRILSSGLDEVPTSTSSTSVPTLMRRRSNRNESGVSHSSSHSHSHVLPPLPHQFRSPSPPILPQSLMEVMDSVDRETQNQDSMEEPSRYLSNSDRRLYASTRNESSSGTLGRGDQDNDMDIDPRLDSRARLNVLDERRRRVERILRENSSSRSDFPRVHSHSSSWSHSNGTRARPREEPDGFFDSQSSTISDIVRTITVNGDLDIPGIETERRTSEDTGASSLSSPNDSRNPWRSGPDFTDFTTSAAPRHHRSASNPPPSIPPPDFGDPSMLIPIDLPEFRPNQEAPGFVPEQRTNERPSIPTSSRPSHPSLTTRHPSGSSHSSNPSTHSRTSSTRGVVDVDSFAGPFRTTVQRMVDQGRLRSSRPQIPLIPPLTFDDDFESFGELPRSSRAPDFLETRAPSSGHVHNTSVSRPSHGTSRERSSSLSRRTSLPSSSVRGDLHPFRRPSVQDTDSSRNLNRQRLDDLHRVMTSHARIGASLLHGSDMPSRQSHTAPGESEGFNQAIEVLRHDGLSEARSQQLIDRYHRERSVNAPSPSSSSSLWGTLEDDSSSRNNHHNWRGSRGSSLFGMPPSSESAGPRTTRRPSPRPFDRAESSQDIRPRASRSIFGMRSRNSASFGDDLIGGMLLPPRRFHGGGNFSLGDFMRDEDFDSSYEGLSILGAALGEVKPRGTPNHVVAGLDTAFYKDWVTDDCDKRCPICLDDYKNLDPVMKLKECSHWLHKSCLEQWLKGAATCPVCRKSVIGSPSPSFNTPGPSSSSDSNLRTAPEPPLRWHFHHMRRLPLRPPAEAGPSRSRSNNANTNQAPESSNSASITTGLRLGQRYSSGVATSSSSQTSRPSRARRNTNTNNNSNHSNTNASREAEAGADSGSSESGTGSDSADDFSFTRNSRPAWGRYMP